MENKNLCPDPDCICKHHIWDGKEHFKQPKVSVKNFMSEYYDPMVKQKEMEFKWHELQKEKIQEPEDMPDSMTFDHIEGTYEYKLNREKLGIVSASPDDIFLFDGLNFYRKSNYLEEKPELDEGVEKKPKPHHELNLTDVHIYLKANKEYISNPSDILAFYYWSINNPKV